LLYIITEIISGKKSSPRAAFFTTHSSAFSVIIPGLRPCTLQVALRAFKYDAVEFVSGNKSDAEPHDTVQEQASSGDPGSAACRELCTRMLDRKTLTAIRHDTEKGLGIGQADFLLKITRLTRGVDEMVSSPLEVRRRNAPGWKC
jgi:hypothetical protein